MSPPRHSALSLPLGVLVLALCALGCSQAQIGDGPNGELSGGPDAGAATEPDADLSPPDAALPDAGPVPATLSHSASNDIVAENSIACADQETKVHTENSYYRVFDLEADFDIDDDFRTSTVSLGVETATGNGGAQPLQVRLHTLTGDLLLANLDQISSAEIEVPDQTLSILEVPLEATVPAGSKLVVEILTPDGTAEGNSLFVGSNAAGQTSPTYLRAPAEGCELAEPTDVADLGFPDMHMVLEVAGESQGS